MNKIAAIAASIIFSVIVIGILIYLHIPAVNHLGQRVMPIPSARAITLIGTWNDTSDNTHQLRFNADGTFAELINGAETVYNTRYGFSPPSSPTTTGLWSVVVDKSTEMNDYNKTYLYDPPLLLPSVTAGSIILKEDVGAGFPWYFDVSMSGTDKLLVSDINEGDGQRIYTREK